MENRVTMNAKEKKLIDRFKRQSKEINKLISEIKEKGVIIRITKEDDPETINRMFCKLKQFNYLWDNNNEQNSAKHKGKKQYANQDN